MSDFSIYYTDKAGGTHSQHVDYIHVKDNAMQDLPLCRCNPKNEPMAWTGRMSARAMATCVDCLADVLRDDCVICAGTGDLVCPGHTDCCGPSQCGHCDLDAAYLMIENRGKEKP